MIRIYFVYAGAGGQGHECRGIYIIQDWPHGAHERDGKYISLSRQEKINKELSAIWLKEKQ